MDIRALEVFIILAEGDLEYACQCLACEPADIIYATHRLQRYIGFKLYEDFREPTRETITTAGLEFLSYAKQTIGIFQNGVSLAKRHADNGKLMLIKASFARTREYLVDSIAKVYNDPSLRSILIDIDVSDKEPIMESTTSAHAIFCPGPGHDHFKMFKKQWGITMTQSLYATRHYLNEVGEPTKVSELLNQSVIGIGRTFLALERKQNWHLYDHKGQQRITPNILVADYDIAFKAIMTDLGIGPAYDHCAAALPPGQLICVLPDNHYSTHVGFYIRREVDPRLTRCLALIEEKLKLVVEADGLPIEY